MILSQKICKRHRDEIISRALGAHSVTDIPLVIRDELVERGWRAGDVSLSEVKSILDQALRIRRAMAEITRRMNASTLLANPPFGCGNDTSASEVA